MFQPRSPTIHPFGPNDLVFNAAAVTLPRCQNQGKLIAASFYATRVALLAAYTQSCVLAQVVNVTAGTSWFWMYVFPHRLAGMSKIGVRWLAVPVSGDVDETPSPSRRIGWVSSSHFHRHKRHSCRKNLALASYRHVHSIVSVWVNLGVFGKWAKYGSPSNYCVPFGGLCNHPKTVP